MKIWCKVISLKRGWLLHKSEMYRYLYIHHHRLFASFNWFFPMKIQNKQKAKVKGHSIAFLILSLTLIYALQDLVIVFVLHFFEKIVLFSIFRGKQSLHCWSAAASFEFRHQQSASYPAAGQSSDVCAFHRNAYYNTDSDASAFPHLHHRSTSNEYEGQTTKRRAICHVFYLSQSQSYHIYFYPFPFRLSDFVPHPVSLLLRSRR